MKVGLFITNQQTIDTDMVSALDDQFTMVRATAGGTSHDCCWPDKFASGCRWRGVRCRDWPCGRRACWCGGRRSSRCGLGDTILGHSCPVPTSRRL
jgi:hypothetical protein